MKREDVYKLIDGERDYQDSLWTPETTTSGGQHSFEEWIVYIEDYLAEAKHLISRNAYQKVEREVAGIMRKVAGMAVCCLEQHGAPPRG